MEAAQDFYALLGVSQSATAEEIKRAYSRKRREYQNDEEKSTQLNQAYDVLCNPAKRSQYDVELQYGNRIARVKENINSSETLEEHRRYLLEAEGLYLEVLEKDAENQDALWNLANIEEAFEKPEKAVTYLMQLEQLTSGEEKLQVYRRLGAICKKLGKVDEAIKCYYAIYKVDVTAVEDIKALVRLGYEEKKNLKTALQILNDCVNRCEDNPLKITYIFETLRAIIMAKSDSYQKVEEVLWKRLASFVSEDEDENFRCAFALVSGAGALDVDDDAIIKYFEKFLEVYRSYGVKNDTLNKTVESVRQLLELTKQNKVHDAVDLYMEEVWTEELRQQLAQYIADDAAGIKESLEAIRKEAPLYWEDNPELKDLEKVIDENLVYSNELKKIKKDFRISSHMKRMVELLLLNVYMSPELIREELYRERDAFFSTEDKEVLKTTLIRMEEYYPASYEYFADVFLEGKSTIELFGEGAMPAPRSVSRENPASKGNAEADNSFLWRLGIGFIIIVCFAFPPMLLIVIGGVIFYCWWKHDEKPQSGKLQDQTVTTQDLVDVTKAEQARLERERAARAEQERIKAEQERKKQEKLEKKAKRKKRRKRIRRILFLVILIFLVVRGYIWYRNSGEDGWKQRYYEHLNEMALEVEEPIYYSLQDMNFDGIKELIIYYVEYYRNVDGIEMVTIYSTDQDGENLRSLYSDYHVFPTQIGYVVTLSSSSGDRIYRCLTDFGAGIISVPVDGYYADCEMADMRRFVPEEGLRDSEGEIIWMPEGGVEDYF